MKAEVLLLTGNEYKEILNSRKLKGKYSHSYVEIQPPKYLTRLI